MSKKNNATGEDSKKKMKSNAADDGPRKIISTSNNTSANGLKRPLSCEVGRISARKKLRTTINSSEKLDELTLTIKSNEENVEKYPQDSIETRKNDNKKNKNEKIDNTFKILKTNSPAKKNISNEIGKTNKNELGNSSSIKKTYQKKTETESVNNSQITNENISPLKNGLLPSDKLVNVDNSNNEEIINTTYEKSSSAVISPAKTDNLINKSNTKKPEISNIENNIDDSVLNNDKCQTVTLKSPKNIESTVLESSNHNIGEEVEPNEHDINVNPKTNKFTDKVSDKVSENTNDEIIDTEKSSDLVCDITDDNPNNLLNDVINGLKKITKDNFHTIMKLFAENQASFEEFEAICTVKVMEYMTDRYDRGKERTELKMLLEREQHWRKKYASLTKQMREIKAVVKLHNNELKTNKDAKPHLVQRTVGLQAVICTKKEATTNTVELPTVNDKPQTLDIPSDNNGPTIDITNINNDTIEPEPTSNQLVVEILSDNDDVTSVVAETVNDVTTVATETVNDVTSVATETVDDVTSVATETVDDVTLVSAETVNGVTSFAADTVNGVTSFTAETAIPSTSKTKENTTPKKSESPSNVLTLSPVVLKKAVPPAVPLSPLNKIVINNSATIDLTSDDGIEISNGYSLESSPIKIVHTTGSSPKQLTNNVSAQVLSKSLGFIDLSQPPSGYLVRTNATKGPTQLASVSSLNPNSQTNNQPFLIKGGRLVPVQLSPVNSRQIQTNTVTYSTRQLSSQHNGVLQPVPPAIPIISKHPAPLPEIPNQRSLPSWKKLPPPPKVTVTKTTQTQRALVLSWNMPPSNRSVADVSSYQIFAYHETGNDSPRIDLWKKIGDVNALPLPMACSLTQFRPGEKYHFAIRAVDTYHRIGPFSDIQTVFLIHP